MAKGKGAAVLDGPAAEREKGAGEQLLDWLESTGTGESRLRPARDAVRRLPHLGAEEVLALLEQSGCPVGTLRKAGKHVHGEDWEPARLVPADAAEELKLLREEVKLLRQAKADAAALARGTVNANNALRDRVAELTQQVAFLKFGKSSDDLAAFASAFPNHQREGDQ